MKLLSCIYRKYQPSVWLLLILLIALFLRLYQWNNSPPSLNWDEVSIAYNAKSILETGRDEWGRIMPLHFRSFGEYKLPAQIYFSIPAIALFGLSPFAVRITPILYGTLTVLLLYFFTHELFKEKKIALLASFFLAISPWHVQLTRASFESSFSVFWVVLALLLLIKGIHGKSILLFFSAIAFAISVYTYNSARVFTPLFLIGYSLLFFSKIRILMKKYVFFGLTFVILMLPLAPFVVSGEAAARYKLVSVTNEAGLIPRINERRTNSRLPVPITRLIHNRVTYVSFYLVKNYLAHIPPNFLFIKGAGHAQHHVQGMGELFKIQLPYLIFGAWLLLKKKEHGFKLLLLWFALALIPVSTTKDSIPNALRTLLANPPLQIITAYGGYNLFLWVKKYGKGYAVIFILLSIFVLLIEISLFTNNLWRVYPGKYSRDWQYGYQEVYEYIKTVQDRYDLVVVTRDYGEPHIFALFYLNYAPRLYQEDPNLVRFQSYDWVWVTNFGKYYFPDLGDRGTTPEEVVKNNPNKKILIIGTPFEIGDSYRLIKSIHFLDGKEAFRIIEVI